MPGDVKTLRIVVASPSDVRKERQAVEAVAAELNNGLGNDFGVLLTVSRWETQAFPGFHRNGPQGLIDEILSIPDCDIFVGIFWKRFGTPAHDSASGTVHEFTLAYEAWKQARSPDIMFYFNEALYTPKTLEEAAQCAQIIEFKKAFPKEGMWWVYKGASSFQALLRQHLTRQLIRAHRLMTGATTHSSNMFTRHLPTSKGFRGREEELRRLQHYFQDPNVTIVVIEGISGIGKSALVKHFASTATASTYLCFWFDCRDETTLDSLAWELTKFARSHGLEQLTSALESPKGSVSQRMTVAADALADLHVAIFLDDYHLVSDLAFDGFIIALEERGHSIKVFLISRRRLPVLGKIRAIAIAEEHLNHGLDVEVCREFLSDAGVVTNTAIGQAIWKLTGEGHPKALQLFAYRAKRIPAAQLLSKMPVFREDLMKEWLLPLLNDLGSDERSMLIDLSVFDRSINFSRLQALFPERDTDVLLVSLLERFLLDVLSGETFLMHPLVRDVCYQFLQQKDVKHRWAAEHYVEQCGPIADPDFASDTQIDCMLAAWSHYIRAEDYKKATEVVEILRPPLMNKGQYDQVVQLLEKTVPTDPVDIDFFVIQRARLLSVRGQGQAAIEMIKPLLDSPNERTVREAILVLSTIFNESHAASDSIQLLESKRRLFMGSASNRLKSRFLLRLIHAHMEIGNTLQALEWASNLCQSSEVSNDKISGAIALREMGVSYESQGKFSTALQFSEMSLHLLEEAGRIREATISRLQVGRALLALGNTERARAELEAALEAFLVLGDRLNMGECRNLLSRIFPFSGSA
jgi:tetratricopeptide (TPR) repeat protein